MERAISSIVIGERVRKDMGDIAALAYSICDHGLLHPVAITPEGLLIAGERRLLACSQLGMTTIPVRVIDVADLLAAERDENAARKDFTPSEAVAIARVIEARLREGTPQRIAAAAAARWAHERGEEVGRTESGCPTSSPPLRSAAASVGMGHGRYEQARAVVEAAQAHPEAFGDLIERMDSGDRNVSAAHRELRRRQKEKRDMAEFPATMAPAEILAAWSARYTDKGQTPPQDRLWKLDRTARVAPDLAIRVLKGELSVSRAYDMQVQLRREHEANLRQQREARASAAPARVVPITTRRSAAQSVDVLREAVALLRSVFDDNYSAMALRQELSNSEAARLVGDVSVSKLLLSRVWAAWSTPERKGIAS